MIYAAAIGGGLILGVVLVAVGIVYVAGLTDTTAGW